MGSVRSWTEVLWPRQIVEGAILSVEGAILFFDKVDFFLPVIFGMNHEIWGYGERSREGRGRFLLGEGEV